METSLPALESCFSTSKTTPEPKGRLFLPLLSVSFFASGTPKPLKGLLSGTVHAPAQPSPEAGGGAHKRCQEPIKASFFLP